MTLLVQNLCIYKIHTLMRNINLLLLTKKFLLPEYLITTMLQTNYYRIPKR